MQRNLQNPFQNPAHFNYFDPRAEHVSSYINAYFQTVRVVNIFGSSGCGKTEFLQRCIKPILYLSATYENFSPENRQKFLLQDVNTYKQYLTDEGVADWQFRQNLMCVIDEVNAMQMASDTLYQQAVQACITFLVAHKWSVVLVSHSDISRSVTKKLVQAVEYPQLTGEQAKELLEYYQKNTTQQLHNDQLDTVLTEWQNPQSDFYRNEYSGLPVGSTTALLTIALHTWNKQFRKSI